MTTELAGIGAGLWTLHSETVRPEWVDYNGHMNVAYYVLVFDHGTDAALDRLGLGEVYREATSGSVFVGEAHITYEQEVHAGQRLTVSSRVLGYDSRRLILYHEMFAEGLDGVVATNEVLCLHVDLRSRRTSPIPPEVRERIEAAHAAHTALPPPSRAGRAVRLSSRRPVQTAQC